MMLKKTKIVCTMGPSCEYDDVVRELILNGMNVARFNFSHGDHEEQMGRFERLVRIREELNIPVAALMDTKGPEIRLGVFENGKEVLEDGATFILTADDILGNVEKASITYKNLKDDVHAGSTILINDGLIELVVNEVKGNDIICTVVHGGVIANKKGINVPGVELSMPYLSEVDTRDILFAAKTGFDFVAASFVRTAQDVKDIRRLLDSVGSNMKIIAKIENRQGVDNLDEILAVSNGIMVARGDMGVEIPFEEVPHIQKLMIAKANAKRKHVITATQMLESMINNPRPTRAEVADVANAVYDGTTAIMLSGETAAGKYPVEAVKTMARIAVKAEGDVDYAGNLARRGLSETDDLATAIAYAACTTAVQIKAKAIITVTITGSTCKKVACLKPPVPLIGCSMNHDVCRKMSLMWGVESVYLEEKATEEELFAEAVQVSKEAGYVNEGDRVVIVAGVPLGKVGSTNMIRVVDVK